MEATLLSDTRKIRKIRTDNEWWEVGNKGIAEIAPYAEHGKAIWFAVKRQDEVITRVNAAFVVYVDYL